VHEPLKAGEEVETLTLCPAMPSKINKPILLAVLIDTVVVVPRLARAAKFTCEAEYPDGGMKRSAELVAVPEGELMVTCPEDVSVGTTICMLDAVTLVGRAAVVLFTAILSFCGARSKFAPATVTTLPAAAICGVKESIRGAPEEAATVKESELVADPLGAVMEIAPVVAPVGTETTNVVLEAEMTVALVPLNVTVFWLAVGLKFAPVIVTCVPMAPIFGVKDSKAGCVAEYRVIARIFPTAS
jgi:hypothetical protein